MGGVVCVKDERKERCEGERERGESCEGGEE